MPRVPKIFKAFKVVRKSGSPATTNGINAIFPFFLKSLNVSPIDFTSSSFFFPKNRSKKPANGTKTSLLFLLDRSICFLVLLFVFRLFINVVLFDRLICCAVAGDLDISQAREFLDKTNSDFAKRIRIARSLLALSLFLCVRRMMIMEMRSFSICLALFVCDFEFLCLLLIVVLLFYY